MQGKVRVALPFRAAAVTAGEFDRGWLPDVLKPDVTNIGEWHDIASNEVRGKSLSTSGWSKAAHHLQAGSDVPQQNPVHA